MLIVRSQHGNTLSFQRTLSERRKPQRGAFGGTFRSDKIFQLEKLIELLEEHAPKLDRFKGIFQTEEEWVRLEIANGSVIQKDASSAAQSSADWIGTLDSHLFD